MRTEDIWWKRLSNPVNLVDSIVDSLIENRSVVVVHRMEIPWEDTFRGAVIDSFSLYNSSMRSKYHLIEKDTDPGVFLMEKYCTIEEQGRYWKPSGSRAKFLAESKTTSLNRNHLLLDIKGTAQEWIDFIDEYSSYFPPDDEHGLFILFTNDLNIKGTKYIDRYYYDEKVSSFDSLLLCMTVLSGQKCNTSIKQYISEIAVSIAGKNVECAGRLAEYGEELAKRPYDIASSVLSNEEKPHDVDELIIALWQAQIKVMFPILEQFRLQLITKHEKQIERA